MEGVGWRGSDLGKKSGVGRKDFSQRQAILEGLGRLLLRPSIVVEEVGELESGKEGRRREGREGQLSPAARGKSQEIRWNESLTSRPD